MLLLPPFPVFESPAGVLALSIGVTSVAPSLRFSVLLVSCLALGVAARGVAARGVGTRGVFARCSSVSSSSIKTNSLSLLEEMGGISVLDFSFSFGEFGEGPEFAAP